MAAAAGAGPHPGGFLRDFIEPYFQWDLCPRIAERRADGKRINRQHAKHQRAFIENYILTDSIADIKVKKITRGDIKDFKARLIKKYGQCRTVNSIITVIKTIFHDAVDREILGRGPTAGIGKIKYDKRETGIFTPGELGDLFPAEGLGPWQDIKDYTAFLIAATCVLRRGELLALCWRCVDFEKKQLRIEEAWRDEHEIVEPKWGQKRTIPLPIKTIRKLKELRAGSYYVLPDSFILSSPAGGRLGATWFTRRFNKAMEQANINRAARNIKAHSFRHSLNTILRDKGYSDEKILAVVSWSNPQTQEAYTHWKPEHLAGQADIVDGIFKMKTLLITNIPEPLHKSFKTHCAANGITMSDLP
ncbi:Tyrosine recombinase XerC [subsurface metagenome]